MTIILVISRNINNNSNTNSNNNSNDNSNNDISRNINVSSINIIWWAAGCRGPASADEIGTQILYTTITNNDNNKANSNTNNNT